MDFLLVFITNGPIATSCLPYNHWLPPFTTIFWIHLHVSIVTIFTLILHICAMWPARHPLLGLFMDGVPLCWWCPSEPLPLPPFYQFFFHIQMNIFLLIYQVWVILMTRSHWIYLSDPSILNTIMLTFSVIQMLSSTQ